MISESAQQKSPRHWNNPDLSTLKNTNNLHSLMQMPESREEDLVRYTASNHSKFSDGYDTAGSTERRRNTAVT